LGFLAFRRKQRGDSLNLEEINGEVELYFHGEGIRWSGEYFVGDVSLLMFMQNVILRPREGCGKG